MDRLLYHVFYIVHCECHKIGVQRLFTQPIILFLVRDLLMSAAHITGSALRSAA